MQSIVQLRKAHPDWTLQKIGDAGGGVTKARVRQVLQREGLPTRRPKKVDYCLKCNTEITRQRKYCKPCLREQHYVDVTCNHCGKPKQVTRTEWNRKKKDTEKYPEGAFYCDRICFGSRLGTVYGFGAHKTPKAALGDQVLFKETYSTHSGHVGTVEIRESLGKKYQYTIACECGDAVSPPTHVFNVTKVA
jgi:hypothetical protein